MKVTRTCMLDGKTYVMNIPSLTSDKLVHGTLLHQQGTSIQNSFPYLTADEREFLLTETPPDVWDKLIGPVNVSLSYSY
jgi:hypothetical protein